MYAIHTAISAQMPPEGYPETIDTPHLFLQALNVPTVLWAIRILLAVAFLTLLLGLWYYDRRERQASLEEETLLPEEKGETE